MRSVAYGSHFKTCHIWFEQFSSNEDLSRLKQECFGNDCLVVHANEIPLVTGSIKQESLFSDLYMSDSQLLSLMTKTIRNEINRAERENVEVEYYSNESDCFEVLNAFSKMYREMYEQKGLKGIELPVKELSGYIKAKQLLISCAKIDGKPIVFHSYVYGDRNSRLLHSCSEFRTEDNATRNAIGRANKYLHWRDMLYLKNNAVMNYDWGGVSSLSNPNGIDQFKLSFGATPLVYFNFTIPLTIKYKVYSFLSHILR